MKNEVLSLTYESSLTDLCEINSSFDSGILRIAYAGDNRNGSSISKPVFEKCIQTIFNCPIVCNYDRDSDTLGGHDMEVVRSDDGSMKLVNLTQPVGVIPQNARVFWETVTEDDGSAHEYLCAEALIWKRQEAYKKIKEDGITAQSMEITVKDGQSVNGIYCIYDFEFTAFALIGVEPCFESAALSFSRQDIKQQFSEMMLELKDVISKGCFDKQNKTQYQLKNKTEGGEQVLDKNELIAKYGIDVNTLDFSIDDFDADELEKKFKEIKLALTGNILDEIMRTLSNEKVQCEWGECSRYCFADCDFDAMEVYCWDTNDWLLYGFPYQLNGDNVVIDFECKKRKKYVISDFDEGEQESPFAPTYSQMTKAMDDNVKANKELNEKYQASAKTIASMEAELNDLRKFKTDTEELAVKSARIEDLDNVFSQFDDLNGVDAFENLKSECSEDCMKYDADTVEEKCYAIRGRHGVPSKFSLGQKVPKLKVEKQITTDLPYGGAFEEYGFSATE